jgi:hypothetical protein
MSEDTELSRVIGSIYDAARDPALWTYALAQVAGFVGGQPGALGSKDMVNKFVKLDYHVGLDLQYMQMYSETYGEFDPPRDRAAPRRRAGRQPSGTRAL